MNCHLAQPWLRHIKDEWSPAFSSDGFSILQSVSQQATLLVYDGWASHLDPSIVDAADRHQIHLFCLPSNTTHELQPMDKSVFRSFETYWDEEILKFWRLHPDRQVNKDRFGKIFTPAWYKALTPTNVINGFKSTGLYPFDEDAIPPEAFAPSDITFRDGMVK